MEREELDHFVKLILIYIINKVPKCMSWTLSMIKKGYSMD